MSKFIRRLVKVGLARETSRGNGAVPLITVPNVQFTHADKIEEVRSEASLGHISDYNAKYVIEKYAQGILNGEIRANSIGYILLGILGNVSSVAGGDSQYTHTFSILNTNQHPSLSIEVQDPDRQERFRLAMLNSLKLSAELGGMAMFESEFISKRSGDSDGQLPAITSEQRFTKAHVTIKIADTIAGLSAATPLNIKNLSLNISKNVFRDTGLGTVQPLDILNQALSINGDLNLNYTDLTMRNYMLNGNYKAVEIKFSNPDELIGSSSTASLTIQLPRVDFSGWELDGANNDIVAQKINFTANKDIANSLEAISTCELVNGYANYNA